MGGAGAWARAEKLGLGRPSSEAWGQGCCGGGEVWAWLGAGDADGDGAGAGVF